MSKGESLRDTVLTVAAMGVDALVIRHMPPPVRRGRPPAGSTRHVLNAGDGTHEHPTQALLDAFTMRRHFRAWTGRRSCAGKTVAIVGDVTHSRVARSNVLLLQTLGAEVVLVAPPTLLPSGVDRWPVRVAPTWTRCCRPADAVMMLRVQRERMSRRLLPDRPGVHRSATA